MIGHFKLSAVIFDLDGLMVDTEPLAKQAWSQVLLGYGQTLTDELFEKMIGLRLEDSSGLLIRELGLSVGQDELSQSERAFFMEIMKSGVDTMPGLHAVLDRLQRYELPWAVATSSELVYARRVLSMIGLLDRCQSIAAGDEVERGKPYPDLYLLAGRRMGVNPEECLALEDSVPGCQAAKAAGMYTIAVPSSLVIGAEYDCAELIFSSLDEVAAEIDRFMRGEKRA